MDCFAPLLMTAGDRGNAGPKSTFKKQKFFASFFQKRSALPYFSEFD
jgi:hypothetical protein